MHALIDRVTRVPEQITDEVMHVPRAVKCGAQLALGPVLLILATVVLARADDVLPIHSHALVYLAVVAVVAAVCGLYASAAVAIAASLLLDYFFVPPLFSISFDLDCGIFLLSGLFVGVIVAHERERHRRLAHQATGNVQAAVDETFRAVGAKAWSAVWDNHEGKRFLLWPLGQRPEVTTRHFTKAAHVMTCVDPDCRRCWPGRSGS